MANDVPPTSKSVLDKIEVREVGFPLDMFQRPAKSVVGSCPACGAPVYGYALLLDNQATDVRHSCACRERNAPVR